MSRNICIVGIFLVAITVLFAACDLGGEPAPAPPPVPMQPIAPPVQPVPVPEPVVPAAPPPTPLIPIEAETGTNYTGGGGGGNVDAPILGTPTDGSELIGNYSCSLDAKGLPTGPFNLPPFGCKIFRAGDGSIKVGPTGRVASGGSQLKGTIKDSTDKGFFIIGKYQFPGNDIAIKARMKKKQSDKPKYSGNGRGKLNDGQLKIKYTLTMNRK